jgi:hypothetical protein
MIQDPYINNFPRSPSTWKLLAATEKKQEFTTLT